VFSITQTLADGSQETLPSTGAGLPSPGGGDVFGGNQGGCDPDPPPPPGPSGPTWVNTFHHRDHLGSLRVTTDAAGWMLSGHDFYPFGMEVAESGQAAGGPSRMKFTGHERDDLTGLDYMKARYSGWFQASFLIPDPANDVNPRNPQSWNRYAYVRNNPMNLVDPSGMNVEDTANTVISKDPCGTNQGGGATCDDRGLKARNEDASKEADEANRKEEGKEPAAQQKPKSVWRRIVDWILGPTEPSEARNQHESEREALDVLGYNDVPTRAERLERGEEAVRDVAAKGLELSAQIGAAIALEKIPIGRLIPGRLHRAKSFHTPYAELPLGEIRKLAKAGDARAQKMLKLFKQQERLAEKAGGKP
jgi:RHS repeat-associated protein